MTWNNNRNHGNGGGSNSCSTCHSRQQSDMMVAAVSPLNNGMRELCDHLAGNHGRKDRGRSRRRYSHSPRRSSRRHSRSSSSSRSESCSRSHSRGCSSRRRSSRHRRLVCISVCLFLCSCCALVITCGYWLRAALCGVPLPQMLPPLSPDTNLPRVPVVDVLLSPMLELEFNNSEARRSMTSGYHAPACLPSATHQPRMCVSDQPHTSAVSDQPRTCVQ
jgi:hypothetical protein